MTVELRTNYVEEMGQPITPEVLLVLKGAVERLGRCGGLLDAGKEWFDIEGLCEMPLHPYVASFIPDAHK